MSQILLQGRDIASSDYFTEILLSALNFPSELKEDKISSRLTAILAPFSNISKR
jgi:hypothetical protein